MFKTRRAAASTLLFPPPEVRAVWSWRPNQTSLSAQSTFLLGQWFEPTNSYCTSSKNYAPREKPKHWKTTEIFVFAIGGSNLDPLHAVHSRWLTSFLLSHKIDDNRFTFTHRTVNRLLKYTLNYSQIVMYLMSVLQDNICHPYIVYKRTVWHDRVGFCCHRNTWKMKIC